MVYTFWPGDTAMKDNRIRVKQGESVFTQGDQGDCMYVIVEGQVQIVREGGSSPTVLANLGVGAFFGEMAVLHRTTRTATALAISDVVLIVVKAPDLELLLTQRPDVGAKMIRTLTRRLEHTTNQVMDEKEKIALLFDYESNSEPQPQSCP